MRTSRVRIDGRPYTLHSFNTIVIGSGAAGLNAAVRLHEHGQTDIAVVTEGLGAGTSANAGSDKQTYYKLALSGDRRFTSTGPRAGRWMTRAEGERSAETVLISIRRVKSEGWRSA